MVTLHGLQALEKGVLKILSKMGISLLSCYHGAQIFEAYGLGPKVVDTAFRGSVSRIGGMSFADVQVRLVSLCDCIQEKCIVHKDLGAWGHVATHAHKATGQACKLL